MEKQFKINTAGTEITISDLELIGTEAALADDKVFAALLKLVPYNGSTVYKGVLPKRDYTQGLVKPGSGVVTVAPFRVFIGTRTAATTSAKDNRDDIRSSLYVGSSATSGVTTLTITDNSSGNPRWDLVYAKVTVDNNDSSVTRYVKDTTSKVVTPTAVTVTKNLLIELFVQQGTPSATPVPPAAPSDSGSIYYLQLAYVVVPNGYAGAGMAVKSVQDCYTPVLPDSQSIGLSARPASEFYNVGTNGAGGTILTAARLQDWCTTNTKPAYALSPSMVGLEYRTLLIDLTSATSSNWNVATSAQLLDDTIDWRKRFFWWNMCMLTQGSRTAYFATEYHDNTSEYYYVPSPQASSFNQSGFGQSFRDDSGTIATVYNDTLPANSARVIYIESPTSDAYLSVYVNLTDGKLYCQTTGTTFNSKNFFALFATGASTDSSPLGMI